MFHTWVGHSSGISAAFKQANICHNGAKNLLKYDSIYYCFYNVTTNWNISYTDRKNVTNFLYLVLHLACKVTCYFRLFSLVLVSVLRTSINVLSKSKSRNYVTWIANLTKLFLSVYMYYIDQYCSSTQFCFRRIIILVCTIKCILHCSSWVCIICIWNRNMICK